MNLETFFKRQLNGENMNLEKFSEFLNEDYIRTNLTAVKTAINYTKTLSDEEVEVFNDAYYGFLETAGEIAINEYEMNPDVVILFFKFLIMSEIYYNVLST